MAVNTQGAAMGAASGAASGAVVGSAVPGIGTAYGALAGGVLGGLGGLLGGGGGQVQQTKLPGYAQDLGKRIGYGTLWTLNQQTENKPLINDTQRTALNSMYDTARQGTGLGQLPTEYLQQLYSGSGLSAQSEDVANSILQGYYANPARDTVAGIAAGNDVGNNPYLDNTYNRAAKAVTQNYREATSPGITSNAAMAGRLGSGTYARMRNNAESAVGDQLTSLANQVYGGAYESERGRQMQALGQQAQMSQQEIANRMQAANVYDSGMGRQMQGLGLIPGAAEAQYMDAQKLIDVDDLERDMMFRPFARANATFAGTPMEQKSMSSIQTNPLKDALGMGIGLYSAFKPDAAGAGAAANSGGRYDPYTGRLIGGN